MGACAIRDTKPAAEIDMGDAVPRRAEVGDELADALERRLERGEAGALAADTDRDAAQAEPPQRRQASARTGPPRRKGVVYGMSLDVRVDIGGCLSFKHKNQNRQQSN